MPQGTPIEFDGRGSRAGSGSDPITRYEWDFDDGSDPGDGVQPVHTFVENGTYSVTLTVHDEDSSSSVVVRVEVRDVDPIVEGIDVPEQTYEIARMRFRSMHNRVRRGTQLPGMNGTLTVMVMRRLQGQKNRPSITSFTMRVHTTAS